MNEDPIRTVQIMPSISLKAKQGQGKHVTMEVPRIWVLGKGKRIVESGFEYHGCDVITFVS